MNAYSLGYIKDFVAFTVATILLISTFVFNVKLPCNLLTLLLILIFLFDGVFSFYPHLHNHVIRG